MDLEEKLKEEVMNPLEKKVVKTLRIIDNSLKIIFPPYYFLRKAKTKTGKITGLITGLVFTTILNYSLMTFYSRIKNPVIMEQRKKITLSLEPKNNLGIISFFTSPIIYFLETKETYILGEKNYYQIPKEAIKYDDSKEEPYLLRKEVIKDKDPRDIKVIEELIIELNQEYQLIKQRIIYHKLFVKEKKEDKMINEL